MKSSIKDLTNEAVRLLTDTEVLEAHIGCGPDDNTYSPKEAWRAAWSIARYNMNGQRDREELEWIDMQMLWAAR